MKKFCSYCGAQIPVEGKFCTKCGKPVQQFTEDIELGEVTKINTNKKAMSFNSIKSLPQQKIAIALGVIVLAVVAFFFMSKTPLQGNWKSTDSYNSSQITVTGKKAEITINEDYDMQLTISGNLRKKNKNTYLLPLESTHIKFVAKGTVSDKAEFNAERASMREEIDELSLDSSERKKVEKWINSIKLEGSDVMFESSLADIQEINEILDNEISLPLDFDEFGNSIVLTKKSDKKLVLADEQQMIELEYKKVK